MSVDERLRDGLQGLDTFEGVPSESVVETVVVRGRRHRWNRRLAAATLVVAAAFAAMVAVPKALDGLRGAGERRPALPGVGLGLITTIAGTGAARTSGDGGPATAAETDYPIDLAFDGEGNLYILEHGPPVVRKVDTSGTISTVVGPGAKGEAGQLDLATTFSPSGLSVDAEGNVYLGGGDGSDINNRVIRVDPLGNVTTVAGTGEPGESGDGGPATDATLRRVWDVAVDAQGNVYISGQARIRKVDGSGVITTVAGTGETGFSGDGGAATAAKLSYVTGISVDREGSIFFVDYGDDRPNDRIRRVDTQGIITTIAGPGPIREGETCANTGDGGPATEAEICGAEHLWVDAVGNIYVADTFSHVIRKIDPAGIITTVAGTGIQGFSGDGLPAAHARLSEPSSVAVGPDGALYIADSGNNRVRKIAQ